MNRAGTVGRGPVTAWAFTPDGWPQCRSIRWPPAELVADALSCPVGAVLYEHLTWGA